MHDRCYMLNYFSSKSIEYSFARPQSQARSLTGVISFRNLKRFSGYFGLAKEYSLDFEEKWLTVPGVMHLIYFIYQKNLFVLD